MPFLRCMAGRIRLAPFNDGNETKRSEEMGSSFAATHCATMVRASAHRIDEPNLTTASLRFLPVPASAGAIVAPWRIQRCGCA